MKDFVDERGEIRNIKNVAIITSRKGSVRSNHWHKEGFHYLWVTDGRMLYKERDIGGGNPVEFVVEQGEMVYTPPGKEHRTEFLENTCMISFAGKEGGDEYDRDTVKVEW